MTNNRHRLAVAVAPSPRPPPGSPPGSEAVPRPCPPPRASGSLRGEPRPAGGMVDVGEQRVQAEPLRERTHKLPWAFEFDAAALECRAQAEVSHPHRGQRLRVGADGDVDAEPRIAEAQVRFGED